MKSTAHTDVQIHAQTVCSNSINVAIITPSYHPFLSILSTAARNSQCKPGHSQWRNSSTLSKVKRIGIKKYKSMYSDVNMHALTRWHKSEIFEWVEMPFGFSSSTSELPTGNFYSCFKMFYRNSENYRIAYKSMLKKKKKGEVLCQSNSTYTLQIRASLIKFHSPAPFQVSIQNSHHRMFLISQHSFRNNDNGRNTRSKNAAWLQKTCLISRSATDSSVT